MSSLELLNQLKKKEKIQEQAHREVATSCNGHTKIIVEPIGNAAHSVAHLRLPQEEILKSLSDVTFAITKQTQELKNGDISKIEEMLYSQALTLNAAFHKFLVMAAGGTDQAALMDQRFELITGLAAMALKAQEQSRKTLVALAELKSPKQSTTFVKQYVNQQLNQALIQQNQTESSPPNQLQEEPRAPLDIRSKRDTAAFDTAVEAVGEQQRSQKRSRKKN
jgi:hypothetical protein